MNALLPATITCAAVANPSRQPPRLPLPPVDEAVPTARSIVAVTVETETTSYHPVEKPVPEVTFTRLPTQFLPNGLDELVN